MVGINVELQQMLWALLALVLHIGNIQFETEGKKTVVKNPEQLELVSDLLSVSDAATLAHALTSKSFVSGSSRKSKYSLSLSVSQSHDNKDALAKALYHNVFLWIIHLLNYRLQPEQEETPHGWIGILDIFGFETFENNCFEQLTINYANEKLKQQFNQTVFLHEQQEYIEEGYFAFFFFFFAIVSIFSFSL